MEIDMKSRMSPELLAAAKSAGDWAELDATAEVRGGLYGAHRDMLRDLLA